MYEINLSDKGFKELKKNIKKVQSTFLDDKFIYYLANKSFQLLNQITQQNLNLDELNQYEHFYRNNHQMKVLKDEIDIWNDTMVDLDSLNLSDKTRANYSSGLSLAKIVEYGTGIVGANSEASSIAKDWQYDMNNHGNDGWFYEDNSGQLHFTRGIEGRLIFYKTKEEIEKNLDKWVSDYINKL